MTASPVQRREQRGVQWRHESTFWCCTKRVRRRIGFQEQTRIRGGDMCEAEADALIRIFSGRSRESLHDYNDRVLNKITLWQLIIMTYNISPVATGEL